MTARLDAVVSKKGRAEPTTEERAAGELVRQAREQGLSLAGPDGLLRQLAKMVLETALNQVAFVRLMDSSSYRTVTWWSSATANHHVLGCSAKLTCRSGVSALRCTCPRPKAWWLRMTMPESEKVVARSSRAGIRGASCLYVRGTQAWWKW